MEIIKEIMHDIEDGNRIKCIITDENMENLDGSETIKIIRNLEKKNKLKDIKIISMIDCDDKGKIDNIVAAGADIILNKPISTNSIKNALLNLNVI